MANPEIAGRSTVSPPRQATRPAGSSSGRDGPRLPWSALAAMALTGFVVIMTETLPAGLLPEIAAGLRVSEGAAGQLVSVYAAGTVVAALPVIALTRGLRRKPVYLAAVAGFVITNTVTAVSDAYVLTLVARAVGGMCSGLLWGLIPGYTRGIAPPSRAGRALAVAMAGVPAALSVGTPLGTFGGTLLGWRWTFAALSVLAVVALGWMASSAPDVPGASRATARTPVLRVLGTPGVRPGLAVVLGWMLAHNLLYTYLAPYLAAVGGPGRVEVVLLVFGLAALAGIWVTGQLVDRALRRLTLCSLAAFAGATVVLGVASRVTPVLYAAVVVWGLTFGGASTQLNTAVLNAATPHVDTAAALVSTAWNLAIFGGSALGAILLGTAGAGAFPWTLLALVTTALVITFVSRKHAFTPGVQRPGPTS
ncbi:MULTISPECIES: MFS transporter [Amycolatopsis]|nr:MFS transporter [Amycolatopsis sacchari]